MQAVGAKGARATVLCLVLEFGFSAAYTLSAVVDGCRRVAVDTAYFLCNHEDDATAAAAEFPPSGAPRFVLLSPLETRRIYIMTHCLRLALAAA